MFKKIKKELVTVAVSGIIAIICCFSNTNTAQTSAKQIVSQKENSIFDYSDKENAENYRRTLLLDYQVNEMLYEKYADENQDYARQCKIRANKIADNYCDFVLEYHKHWENEDILYTLPYIE